MDKEIHFLYTEFCASIISSGRQKRYRLLYFFFAKNKFIFYFCVKDDNVFASITVLPPTGISLLNIANGTEAV